MEINGFNVDEFINYVLDFYGSNGVYSEFKFTKEEALIGLGLLVSEYGKDNFEADSLDRERLRDLVLEELRGYSE